MDIRLIGKKKRKKDRGRPLFLGISPCLCLTLSLPDSRFSFFCFRPLSYLMLNKTTCNSLYYLLLTSTNFINSPKIFYNSLHYHFIKYIILHKLFMKFTHCVTLITIFS